MICRWKVVAAVMEMGLTNVQLASAMIVCELRKSDRILIR